jgi:hypothetical protein
LGVSASHYPGSFYKGFQLFIEKYIVIALMRVIGRVAWVGEDFCEPLPGDLPDVLEVIGLEKLIECCFRVLGLGFTEA